MVLLGWQLIVSEVPLYTLNESSEIKGTHRPRAVSLAYVSKHRIPLGPVLVFISEQPFFGLEAGSYVRLIGSCISQLEAQEPRRTCNESKEEEEDPSSGPPFHST